MTEQQFIRELESALNQMSSEERDDILADIREYFISGREDGKMDGEIAASLGSPKDIAKDLLENYVPAPPQFENSNELIHIPHADFSHINMDIDHGSLNVYPSSNDETYIELVGESDKVELTADVTHNTLNIRLKSKKLGFFSFIFMIKELKVNVALPKKLYQSIVMKTDNGRIRAEKLLGKDIKVYSDNGAINLKELAATMLETETDNGRIEIDKVQVEKLTATTDNGRIELRNIEATEVHSETDNGRIIMEYITGNITGKTDNGRIILLTSSLDNMIDLETDNGSIQVETETEPRNVSIHTKTDFGKIDVFGENNSKTVFGEGINKVRLTTDNGRIIVARRTGVSI